MSNIKDSEALKESSSVAPSTTQDAVFGKITEQGPNYRNVGWLGTVALMLKNQLGLGVLSIPQAFDSLGIVPGVICLLAIAAITTWANYVIGTFKLNHPEVYAIDDAGELMFGRMGREVFAFGVCIYWIFSSGSGLLSTSIGLNAVSAHGTCTAVLVAVSAIASFILSSTRTLGKMKWAAWAGVASIFGAVMIATVAVALQERPPTAPQGDTFWVSDYKLVGNPSFTRAITAVASIIFAYSGAPVLGIHFSSKYTFIRLLRGSKHMTANTFKHWATWLGCTFAFTIASYLIASGIPNFGDLNSLIGALLGTVMSFQSMGCMWIYDNWKHGSEQQPTLKWILLLLWNILIIGLGTFMMIGGTYGSIVNIVASGKATTESSAWSCADNSNS
ncbi:hypothetical protein AbraIFM66950_009782 [Aspergillus brasiliensis]|nr:hypothetical protein AbraIFM66950_009782 [Aspergillus brasiliensis]